MPILNYTTSISFEKTVSEIQTLLSKKHATKIISDYQKIPGAADPVPIGITFCLSINGQMAAFSLPAKYTGVLAAMKADRKCPRHYCNDAQALRVSWRIVKDWIQAQMALVEANLAEVAEVFLPYAVTKDGNTLYDKLKKDGNDILMLGQ